MLNCIILFTVKPPTNGTDYYVHRSGRTGRAGRDGVAILLHSGTPEEMEIIREVCMHVDLLFASGTNAFFPPHLYSQPQCNVGHLIS